MADKIADEPVAATWRIELNCDCPKCGGYVDLLTAPDFWDGRCLDLGEHGTERADRLGVVCPDCGGEFEVFCEY